MDNTNNEPAVLWIGAKERIYKEPNLKISPQKKKDILDYVMTAIDEYNEEEESFKLDLWITVDSKQFSDKEDPQEDSCIYVEAEKHAGKKL